jgi:hypothetical protein
VLEKPKNDAQLDDSARDGFPAEDQDESQPTADPPAGHTIGSDI